MSIALLEAMALGIPLVASAIPGNLALSTTARTGRLAPPDDPEALARAILDQWADPDRPPPGRGRPAPGDPGVLDRRRRPQASGPVPQAGP